MFISNPTTPASGPPIPTTSGKHYVARVNVAASVGRYGCAQLLNPAASGIAVYVTRIEGRVVTAGDAQVRSHGTALATDVASEQELELGGGPGTAQARSEQAAAIPGTALWYHRGAANVWGNILTDKIIALDAGEGVLIANATANDVLEVAFFWTEQ
jgi:hypothetical protein